jgi:hypothetical protein
MAAEPPRQLVADVLAESLHDLIMLEPIGDVPSFFAWAAMIDESTISAA